MLHNYAKIAWHSLDKHKLFSVINILGLAISIGCSFLISLWVRDEVSFDRFIPNANRVFRLESITISPDGAQRQLASVGWPAGKLSDAGVKISLEVAILVNKSIR